MPCSNNNLPLSFLTLFGCGVNIHKINPIFGYRVKIIPDLIKLKLQLLTLWLGVLMILLCLIYETKLCDYDKAKETGWQQHQECKKLMP